MELRASWHDDQERRLEEGQERRDALRLAWEASASVWRPRRQEPPGANPTEATKKPTKSEHTLSYKSIVYIIWYIYPPHVRSEPVADRK